MARAFPHYEQLDAMDCGASCLRMVAKYFGRYYSLDSLRERTHMGKQGVSLLGISDAAESIGLQSLAVKTTIDRLEDDIPLPAIAHWQQTHFVVVYKVSRKYVWLGDPAAHDIIKISREEFLESWISHEEAEEEMGVLLLLETTPEFYQQEGEVLKNRSLSYIFKYFKQYRLMLVQLLLGLLLTSFTVFFIPFLFKELADYGIDNLKVNFIYLIIGSLAILFVLQAVAEYFRHWIILHIGVRVNIQIIGDFLIKLTRLPIRYFDSKLTGDLMQRISDHERVQRFFTSTSLLSIFTLLNFVLLSIVLAVWNTTIFWVFSIGTLMHLGAILLFNRQRRRIDYKRFDQSAESQTQLIELINGMQDIKLHNAEKIKRWNWERVQARLFRTELERLATAEGRRGVANLINEAKNLIIITIAAVSVTQSEMTIGMFIAILYVLLQMSAPIRQLVAFLADWQDARISLERMGELHLQEEEENTRSASNYLMDPGDVVFENVHFQYDGPNSPWILRNLNIRIPKGKTTAIVGTSGSGKTTLMKLMLGFYEPTEGVVRVGDRNLKHVSARDWRRYCGVVRQDGYIFHDTIARNIALGDEIVNKRKLLRAVKVANIQSFIESLPLAYNTIIGQEGLGLSEGQRQRIQIARAVYKNPDYLFLDEATSALDSYNEMVIMENLDEFYRRRTVVIVAHRLSTVMNADNIIVLESGEVVEQGDHESLTYLRGRYYQLVRNQLELGG